MSPHHVFTYETRETRSGKTLGRGTCSCGARTRWQFKVDADATRAAWREHAADRAVSPSERTPQP